MSENERQGPGPDADELKAMQAAEEAKADPSLDEVEPAAIDVQEDGSGEKEEPFEKLAAAARKLSPERARAIVEALLFLSEKPLGVEEVKVATGLDPARIRKAFDEISGHFREGVSGIVLHEVAGGWQFRTSPDATDFVRRFLRVKPQRLTRAALETLAIVAYRQPVTRPEVEEIRGVDSGAVMKALLERKLLKILGKKEEPGRPILYGTTREFHELSEEHREIVEREAPPEVPTLQGLVAELADPNLRAALEKGREEGDAALDELERAIDRADESGRSVRSVLDPEPPPEGQGGGTP